MLQNLPILPALLHASVLALLSAAMPLSTILTSTILAVAACTIIENPTISKMQRATSIHAFAFTPRGDMLIAESEGTFTMEEWENAYEHAQRICCGVGNRVDIDGMLDEGEDNGGMAQFVRSTIQEKVTFDLQWKT